MEYIHKKTGNIYVVSTLDAINATNNSDGKRMVVYKHSNDTFVREYDEFIVKFVPMNTKTKLSLDIIEIIKDSFLDDVGKVNLTDTFKDDLGLDSLDMIELIVETEKLVDVEINDIEILDNSNMNVGRYVDLVFENM